MYFYSYVSVHASSQAPDRDTIGRFRNILVKNGLQEKLFWQVVELLTKRGLILKKGTIVDSTPITAPSSTKNREKQRDPEARSTRKGNYWYFRYKAHIGVDKDTDLAHHVKVTNANVNDVMMTSKLLTGDEESIYGDSGYQGAEKRDDAVRRNEKRRRSDTKSTGSPQRSKSTA